RTWKLTLDGESGSRRVQAPRVWDTLELMCAAVIEGDARSGGQVFDGLRDEHLGRPGERADTRADCNGDPCDIVSVELDLAGVKACSDLDPERFRTAHDGMRTSHRSRRPFEGGEEAVAQGLD